MIINAAIHSSIAAKKQIQKSILQQQQVNNKTNLQMINDDPRLSELIQSGTQGDVVIVGVPFDYTRKRTINKGGEDNAPCCLRRFFGKVGPLANPQYGISIQHLKVTDYGNISLQAQNEVVAPERAISTTTQQIYKIIKNNQFPFVFGGAKQTTYAAALAIAEFSAQNRHILIAGRPTLKRPFDGSKLTSDNLMTLLHFNRKHNMTVFGMSDRYLPQQKPSFNYQSISYQQIRQQIIEKEIQTNTQAGTVFKQLLGKYADRRVHVSLSVQAIQRFRGCRDVLSYGLSPEQMMQMFIQCGATKNVLLVDISEFNPSVQDYQSSLMLVNLLYYFLLGWKKRIQSLKTL